MNGAESVFLNLTPISAATYCYAALVLAVALFFKFNRLLSMRNLDVLALFVVMPGMLLVEANGDNWWSYLCLLCGSIYFFVRCLFDLVLVRRPALAPNLNIVGLLWLVGAFFVGLIAVVVRQPTSELRSDQSAPPVTAVPEKVVKKGLDRLSPAPLPEVDRWLVCGLALACHLSIVVGLTLIGWRHFDDLHSGTAAAMLYLLLPYAYFLLPTRILGAGRWDHALPMALMVWSVFAYRRPVLAGALLGVAAGCVFFPIWTLPVWLSFYRGRGLGRFAGAFALTAGLSLAIIGTVYWINNDWPSIIHPLWTKPTWLPWFYDPKLQSFWQEMDWAYRIPVFIIYLAFVGATLFWPAPKNLAHLLALSAAHLIGIQFWYPDQGGVYVLWYLPFMLLLVFRPNLSACQPPLLSGNDWLARRGYALVRLLSRLRRRPEPAQVA